MQRQYVQSVGTDLVGAAIAANTQIGGIRIDNPSGSWLHIEGLDQYVPPFTLAWQSPLLPTQLQVTVRFVDSPSGTPSVLIGSPVTITLDSTFIAASSGFASGSLEQTPGRAQRYRHVEVLGYALRLGHVTDIVIEATTDEQSIVITQIGMFASYPENDTDQIKGMVFGGIFYQHGFDPAIGFARLTISPEMPSIVVDYPPGSVTIPGNSDITAFCKTGEWGGRGAIIVTMTYYFTNLDIGSL